MSYGKLSLAAGEERQVILAEVLSPDSQIPKTSIRSFM